MECTATIGEFPGYLTFDPLSGATGTDDQRSDHQEEMLHICSRAFSAEGVSPMVRVLDLV